MRVLPTLSVAAIVLLGLAASQSASATDLAPDASASTPAVQEANDVAGINEAPSDAVTQAELQAFDESVALPVEAGLAAAGTWYPVASDWATPSNWKCSKAVTGATFAIRSCVVRVKNNVQATTIIRNITNQTIYPVSSSQGLTDSGPLGYFGSGACTAATFVGNGRAICSVPGGVSPNSVRSSSKVNFPPSNHFLFAGSDWA